MDRFIVVSSHEAQAKGFPDMFWSAQGLEHFWCLYETDGEKPIRLVACDGGEPEDQLLVRDWRWVPEELNKLAERISYLERILRRVGTLAPS